MDASVFTIGLCNQKEGVLEFPAAIEKNQILSPFSVPLSDEAQSFNKEAYSDYHVNILRNLAAYSAIALENADAFPYRLLKAFLLLEKPVHQ